MPSFDDKCKVEGKSYSNNRTRNEEWTERVIRQGTNASSQLNRESIPVLINKASSHVKLAVRQANSMDAKSMLQFCIYVDVQNRDLTVLQTVPFH